MLQDILYLITLHINISQLNILPFLVISDEIFMRQTHRMNGGRLCMMSCKPLIKITHVVESRWVYKIKFNSDGFIDRYKARLVAQGYTQTFGIDYKETFASVAKINIVHVQLLVAVNNIWLMCQMDVKNVFLHGNLEEEVYMKLPLGHPQGSDPNSVCRLHKSIYGLKQSPRAWYA
jgi:hypothetical protein